MNNRNFLLGRGERLAEDVIVRSGPQDKQAPYTFFEARDRLQPMLQSAVSAIDALPDEACPDDQAVLALTLNPEYIAKSYFPLELLRSAGLTTVGSKPRQITPDKRSKDREPEPAVTTELFVMGARERFRTWHRSLPHLNVDLGSANELITIEEISAPVASEKIKGGLPVGGSIPFEVVLHTDALLGESKVLNAFRTYLKRLGVDASLDRCFYAGGLCFVGLDAPVELAETMATFTVVRALREMPRLRTLKPTMRTFGAHKESAKLPSLRRRIGSKTECRNFRWRAA